MSYELRAARHSSLNNSNPKSNLPCPTKPINYASLSARAVQARPTLGPGAPIVVLSGGRVVWGPRPLAIQLARELARLGKRTVLVDANLAEPQLADRLDVQPHGCLADVLDGSRSVGEVLQVVDEGVSLLSLPADHDSYPKLNRAAVARLLAELRSLGEQADIVLVDAGHGMSPLGSTMVASSSTGVSRCH